MNYNKLLGIKSLAVSNRKQLGEKLLEQLKLYWVFDKWYEKIILIIFCLAGFWKIWELILS